jgi:hypothetical protein
MHLQPLCTHIFGDHAFCCERRNKKRALNIIAQDSAMSLSLAIAQAGYLYPNTQLSIAPLFHLCSNPTARPFGISFSPEPTSSHFCLYTTIGADINITGPPPTPKTSHPEDILNTITANADNNLQHHKQGKLGQMHMPATCTTPFIHGDSVISELYNKNMVLLRFTINPWARFGPMLQAFLATTHHPPQKPWCTTHHHT